MFSSIFQDNWTTWIFPLKSKVYVIRVHLTVTLNQYSSVKSPTDTSDVWAFIASGSQSLCCWWAAWNKQKTNTMVLIYKPSDTAQFVSWWQTKQGWLMSLGKGECSLCPPNCEVKKKPHHILWHYTLQAAQHYSTDESQAIYSPSPYSHKWHVSSEPAIDTVLTPSSGLHLPAGRLRPVSCE